MQRTRRRRMLDILPGPEPHVPETRDMALLCFGESGPVDENWFKPTSAAPGSDEKIAVLSFRASKGYPLFHPLDRRDYLGWTIPIPQRLLDRD